MIFFVWWHFVFFSFVSSYLMFWFLVRYFCALFLTRWLFWWPWISVLFALVKLSLCACVSVSLCVCMRAVHTLFTLDEIIRNNENGKLRHIEVKWNTSYVRYVWAFGMGWMGKKTIENIDICCNYRKLSYNQIGYYRIISTHFSSILIRFISISFCHGLLRYERLA